VTMRSDHTGPTEQSKFNVKKKGDSVKYITSHLHKFLGETLVPLSYVIGQEEAVEDEVDDLPGNYESIQLEMTARAPHITAAGDPHPIFVKDNHKVWDILQDICADTDTWTWIKTSAQYRNGRPAYYALFDHYLGASNSNNVQKEARGKLQKTK
jgi:hypothetical protein